MRLRWSSVVAVGLVVVGLVAAAVLRPTPEAPSARQAADDETGLPRMVELGSDGCQACKAMKPVLAQLRSDCAGRLAVDFIDVWKDPKGAEPFAVRVIPTQVFLDASGKEMWRHEGFLAAADIVAKWKALGFAVGATPTLPAPDDFRTRLARALEGTQGLALLAAFVWGVLSIALSPCHLGSIPLVVAFLGGYREGGTARAARVSTVFAVGILAALAVAGGIAVAAGTMAGDVGPWPAFLLSVVLAAFGLYLLGALNLDWATPRLERFAKGGVFAPLVLGFVFGLALGPCAFAFVAPLLAVAFSVAKTHVAFAAGLLLLFALGHCAAIVAGAMSLDRLQRAVVWGGSRAGVIVRGALGVLLVAAALYLTYTAA